MNKKPVRLWVKLLITPIPLIIAATLLQAFVLFSSPGSDPTFLFGVLSVVSLLAGIMGVVLLLGTPIWIVMLISANKHNNQLEYRGSVQASPETQKASTQE